MKTYVFGHKNPDTDSVCSSIAYSYFLNQTGLDTKPMLLGELRKEARFVLDYFNVNEPELIKNLKIQAINLNYDKLPPLSEDTPIDKCFDQMEKQNIHSLPVINDNGILLGICSMSDIAKYLIKFLKDGSSPNSIKVKDLIHKDNIITFYEDDYLDDIKELMLKTTYRNYPVVDRNKKYLGLLGRRHLINPGKKNVILVDHNEVNQSADGIEEAEILQILDHHKIGGIKTKNPIKFINLPVGSSCTIVYKQFKENNIKIPYNIAGLLLSGIISDTLLFKSPTCTKIDIDTVTSLNEILNIDVEDYAKSMFKKGTSIDGLSINEIIFSDFKDFFSNDKKIGISQIFTLDINKIQEMKDNLIKYISDYALKNGYYLLIIAVTDIMEEGSYIYHYSSDKSIIKNVFKLNSQGDFANYLVSRKKQIVPQIFEYLENNISHTKS